MKNIFSNGNPKIGKDTVIFNTTSASACPSRARGLCKIPSGKCYAMKAERQYPSVLPYRERQAQFWRNCTEKEFTDRLSLYIGKRKIKYVRFNEAGDFETYADIRKADIISRYRPDIVFYVYTHRIDLVKRFMRSRIPSRNFIINTSNTKIEGLNQFRTVNEPSGKNAVCPGDCRTCNLCKVNHNKTVEVVIH